MKIPTIPFNHRVKKLIIILGVVIFIVTVSFYSFDAYQKHTQDLINRVRENKQAEIDQLTLKIELSEEYYQSEIEMLEKEYEKIKQFEHEYIKERNRRIRLQKLIDAIRYSEFGRKYLDSLAEHVEYR